VPYLEEIAGAVGAVVVRQREGWRLERRYSRRDVAGQRELLNTVLVECGRHAGRYDHHDRVASWAVTPANSSINQSVQWRRQDLV